MMIFFFTIKICWEILKVSICSKNYMYLLFGLKQILAIIFFLLSRIVLDSNEVPSLLIPCLKENVLKDVELITLILLRS